MADTNLPAGFPASLTDYEAFERWLKAARQQRETEQAVQSQERVREKERREWREAVFQFGPGGSARRQARLSLDEERFARYQQLQGELAREERLLKERQQQEVAALRARYQEETVESEQAYADQAKALLEQQQAAFEGQYPQEWAALQWQNERKRLERLYWDDKNHCLDKTRSISKGKDDPGQRFDEALAEFKPAPPR